MPQKPLVADMEGDELAKTPAEGLYYRTFPNDWQTYAANDVPVCRAR